MDGSPKTWADKERKSTGKATRRKPFMSFGAYASVSAVKLLKESPVRLEDLRGKR